MCFALTYRQVYVRLRNYISGQHDLKTFSILSHIFKCRQRYIRPKSKRVVTHLQGTSGSVQRDIVV